MLFVSHNFLEDLGLVLCVAAATTLIFQLLRQPVVVGYLIAGMLVGPHVPVPLLADAGRIQIISELGVIMLMFALGLEFNLRKLVRLGPTAGFVTALQVGLMLWLGYQCALALGWTELEAIFTGAIISISSSTIVAKAFADEKISARVRDLVFSVLLAEDLVAVALLAALTAIASGAGMSSGMMLATVGRLAGFLAALAGVGMLVVPRLMRWIVRLGHVETTLIASIGLCFAFAIIAERAGYSVVLGAFLAGSLAAESGEAHALETAVGPVRDVFAAIFFVSVGMQIDPRLIVEHWPALAVLTAAVVIGKVFSVSLASMLSGAGVPVSVQSGLSMAQIGEFSFIIAGVGIELRATREFVYSLAAAVSALTTFATPYMIRASGAAAELVGRLVPERVGALESLYDAWMERARTAARAQADGLAGPTVAIVASALSIAGILIVNELDPLDLTGAVASAIGTAAIRGALLVDLGALALCVAPGAGLWFASSALAARLAARTTAESAAVPAEMREALAALESVLRAVILIAVGMPTLALVQPFVGPLEGVGAVAIGTVLLAVVVWRSARRMQGQMRSIARLVADAINRRRVRAAAAPAEIPGLGELTAVTLASDSAAVGRTLAALDLRACTGATVVAISRGKDGVIAASSGEILRAGDVLELAGTSDAVAAAVPVLTGPRRAGEIDRAGE
jgi:K+:H+ antiporter